MDAAALKALEQRSMRQNRVQDREKAIFAEARRACESVYRKDAETRGEHRNVALTELEKTVLTHRSWSIREE
jgi:hypothetical protein